MEIKNPNPKFEEAEYIIETRWYYKDSKELVEDKDPSRERITISSQDQLLRIIEKIGQENREQLHRATELDLRIISEKKLIKL